MSSTSRSTRMCLHQTRLLGIGQVDLGDVAGDNHLGIEAQTGEEHLHLLRRGVLCLIQNDEGVIQGAPAHIGQRRHLDVPLLLILLESFSSQHIKQRVIERTQVGIDLVLQVTRQEARASRPLPRRDG